MAFWKLLLQWTWGLPQTLLGALVYLSLCWRSLEDPGGERQGGAFVTRWPFQRGLSLGYFIFLPQESDRWLLRHEYGHSLQSLALGPFYLPVIGLPSLIWAGLPVLERRRVRRSTSYYAFYTERWADRWGGVEER